MASHSTAVAVDEGADYIPLSFIEDRNRSSDPSHGRFGSTERMPLEEEFDPYNGFDGSQQYLLKDKESNVKTESESDALSARLGQTRRLRIWAILPALLIFFATCGLASALLAWLLSHRVLDYVESERPAFRGAIVAFEPSAGDRVDVIGEILGGDESQDSTGTETTLYGLALSTVAVRVASLSTPFLLSVYAYWAANMWIRNQKRRRTDLFPTPSQYGLTLGLFGAGGLSNLYNATRYSIRKRRERPAISPIMVLAVIGVITTLFFSAGLSIADLWLHTTASTFPHLFPTPIDPEALPAVGSEVNTTACPGPALYMRVPSTNQGDRYANCQHLSIASASSPVNIWGNAQLINEGVAVVSNTSNGASSQVAFMDDIAVLLPRLLPSGVQSLKFDTFGIRATCQPATDCVVDTPDPVTGTVPILTCSSMPRVQINSLVYPNNYTTISGPWGTASSSIQQYYLSDNTLMFETGNGATDGYLLNSQLNSTGAQVVLAWAADPRAMAFPDPKTSPGWSHTTRSPGNIEYFFYVSTCTVSVYNLSVSYSDVPNVPRLSHTSDPIPSNFDTSSALLGALDPLYQKTLAAYMIQTLQPSLTLSPDVFIKSVSQNMSFAMLGYVAGLFQRTNASSGERLVQASVSRYPLAPLLAVLILLYGYALFALVLSATSFFLSSPQIVVVGKQGEVPTDSTLLDHVHLRLTNPSAMVADMFGGAERSDEPRDYTASKDVIFSEGRKTKRLEMGFRGDGESDGTQGDGESVSSGLRPRSHRFRVYKSTS